MNLCESLTISARHFENQTALIFKDMNYSYGELDQLSSSAASLLIEKGIQSGDRVSLRLPNCPAFVVWYYAILRVGAIAVSINPRLSAEETGFILSDSGSKIMIFDEGSKPTVEEYQQHVSDSDKNECLFLAVGQNGKTFDSNPLQAISSTQAEWYQAEPDEPALILYTSGTTGFPKGATLSHLNVRSNVAAFNHLCQMKTKDQVLLAVPLFHCFGQNALLNSVFNVGGTLVLQERFDLNETKRLIRDYSIRQLYGVPMMFQLLLESCDASELESVDYCFSAAAPLSVQTSQQWLEKFGQPIYEGYGLTETSPFASYNHRNHYVMGSIGTPIDAVEMKVVDLETGADCPVGTLGEIAIKGPNVMLGYWNQKDETELAIRNGWFHSGDIGKRDESHFFYIVDRVKDMISIGGLKVFPAEVERVIRDNTRVADVAVVGVPEKVLGEKVVAFIVTKQEAELASELDVYLKDKLADYKLPKQIIYVDEIPRNPSGKVLKTVLRERAKQSVAGILAQDADASIASAGASDNAESNLKFSDRPSLAEEISTVHAATRFKFVREFLLRLIEQVSGEDKKSVEEMTFMEMGLDSLMLVELGSELQIALRSHDPLPASLLFDYPTIDDLTGHLLGKLEIQIITKSKDTPTPNNTDGKSNLKVTNDSLHKPIDGNDGSSLQSEVENLSEEEALDQLLKELE